uniref:Uncharacterized protein n=1 Tax=Arundo donax TaxID=35708 RepID=A0A0A9GKI8_ARUDO
MQESQIVEP